MAKTIQINRNRLIPNKENLKIDVLSIDEIDWIGLKTIFIFILRFLYNKLTINYFCYSNMVIYDTNDWYFGW